MGDLLHITTIARDPLLTWVIPREGPYSPNLVKAKTYAAENTLLVVFTCVVNILPSTCDDCCMLAQNGFVFKGTGINE